MKRKILECLSVGEESNAEITNEEVKRKISEAEEIKILKCCSKSPVDTTNKEIERISCEEEDFGIRKCKRISQV